jgi:hypothetical protein
MLESASMDTGTWLEAMAATIHYHVVHENVTSSLQFML